MSTAPYLGYVYSVHMLDASPRRVPRTRCGKEIGTTLFVAARKDLITCARCFQLHQLDLRSGLA